MLDIYDLIYQKDLQYAATYLLDRKSEANILIIGATGLIGSHLTDIFLYYNRNIRRQFNIFVMGRSIDRLKARFGCFSSDINYLVQDICNPISEDIRFDYIFHFASNADPNRYEKYPTETIETNVLGSINIINYAKKHTDTKILFTSTMEVYGENTGQKLKETEYGALDFNLIRNGYPESKRTAELLYRSAYREYGIKAVIGRLGYIYGPTMTDWDNKIVAQMIRCAIDKQVFQFKSRGSQRRTYCYVTDTVTGILTAVLKGKDGEAYNISDKNSLVSLCDLASVFHEICGLRFEMCDKVDDKARDMILCTEKIRSLGWEAVSNIRDGIAKTVHILQRTKERDHE